MTEGYKQQRNTNAKYSHVLLNDQIHSEKCFSQFPHCANIVDGMHLPK